MVRGERDKESLLAKEVDEESLERAKDTKRGEGRAGVVMVRGKFRGIGWETLEGTENTEGKQKGSDGCWWRGETSILGIRWITQQNAIYQANHWMIRRQ